MKVIILDLLTVGSLLFGLVFMLMGSVGIWRMPDVYSRIHAASKCVTLGIAGMLMASVFHFARLEIAHPTREIDDPPIAEVYITGSTAVVAFTKTVLVILFQFVAAPIAAHMLSRAAHLEGDPTYGGALSDELEEDTKSGEYRRTNNSS